MAEITFYFKSYGDTPQNSGPPSQITPSCRKLTCPLLAIIT